MNRIVLGGFSQGGHIALKALFHKELTLAGCLALSTWLEPQKGQVSLNDDVREVMRVLAIR
jgi:predicted esterase